MWRGNKFHPFLASIVTRPATCSYSISVKEVPIDLYGFRLSQPTRSVLFLCDENKIPYNLISVDARKLETRKPEFLQKFPVGLVPGINDQGYHLTEGPAILQYLCEKHQLHSWYSLEHSHLQQIQLRGQIHFWLHWHHTNVRQSTTKILIPFHYPPKGVSKEEAIAKGSKAYARCMKFVENSLKQRKELAVKQGRNTHGVFLCTEGHPTIADLLLLPEIDQLSATAFNLFDYSPYPHIQEWMHTCQSHLKSYASNFQFVQNEAKQWTGILPPKNMTANK